MIEPFLTEFRKACLEKLEPLGDQTLKDKHYAEAVKYYTAVGSLIEDLDAEHDLLLKRSEAYVGSENLEQALRDADKVQSWFHIHIS